MKNSVIKLGWYCPYSYIFLTCTENIEPVHIEWENIQNGALGTIKLCKKNTSILKQLEAGNLDGLVMVNCCNLAQRLYEFIYEQYPDLFIHQMSIPIKIDHRFEKTLIKEGKNLWIALEAKKSIELDKSRKNRSLCLEKSDVDYKPRWCSLPSELMGGVILEFEDMIKVLNEKILCPRIHNMEAMDIKEEVQDIRPSDTECLPQNYCSVMISLVKEKEGRDDEFTST